MTARIYEFPRSRIVREAPLTKRQLSREIGYSTRWIEYQMRDHGLPYDRKRNGRCEFMLSAVLAWFDRSDPNGRNAA